MALQTIHKQGYLFKEGTFFSTWNERYFSLETSLLKQFTDAENALPTYSIYLGTAAVDGLYSPEDNMDNGHGNMWSLVLRWPLPSSPDILEEQWEFMHLGAYEREEIEEWYDSLVALIKVEQTKRLMSSSGNHSTGKNTPPEYFPVPSGHVASILSSDGMISTLPDRFKEAFERFTVNFNSTAFAHKWTVVSSDDGGMLSRSAIDEHLWKFSVTVPKTKAGAKRLWESLLSVTAGKWEPRVKNSCVTIDEQDMELRGDKQLVTDKWMFNTSSLGPLRLSLTAALDRIAFRDDKSGIYVVLGLPMSPSDSPSARRIGLEYVDWAVESVSERCSCLSVFFKLEAPQPDLLLSIFSTATLADAIVRPAAVRPTCFILSQ